ncbi:MAG TPA: HAMP domain-containing sensor histidine kinase [Gaiellaceae bacterium]|nr:HAMP domain-containing sensor histidine kinase [Gaiellaceae bacterium]
MTAARLPRGFRLGSAFFVAGAVLIGVYFLLPSNTTGQSVIYEGLAFAAALLVLASAWLHRPMHVTPWVMLALALATTGIGDVLVDVHPNATPPSAADYFYLAAYPLIALSLLVLLVRAGGHHRIAALAEAGIVTLAFVLFQWVFLMDPLLQAAGTTTQRAIAATYPAGDAILLAGFAGFFVSPAWRKPAFGLLAAAVLAMILGDELYGFYPTSYHPGGWLDAFWMSSYVLFAAGALHPSMRDLEQSRRQPALRVSSWRILLLLAALLAPAAMLLYRWSDNGPIEVPAVFSATACIAVLVVWRLTGILRALERLRVREREVRAEAEEARSRLAEQNEHLVEADRLKDEFVALISHDLRTPLTSIIGYTELALEDGPDDPLDEERRGYLQIVSRSSERLLRIVDDLLFVARLQAGQGLELDKHPVDLALVARHALEEAGPRARTKELELLYTGPDSAPLVADRGRLFQLLDNLLANAIKFTPEGGTVELWIEPLPNAVALEIRDTGIGLSAGDAERLFDLFFRTARAVNSHIPGTGLGLFIARAIAEAHGGQISAHAREQGGTTFRVELPVEAPVREPAAEVVV